LEVMISMFLLALAMLAMDVMVVESLHENQKIYLANVELNEMQNKKQRLQIWPHSTSGLTLLELMLALASTIIILLSLTAMYVTVEKNFATQEALNQIAENAGYAIRILQNTVHQAGDIGCAKLQTGFPITSTMDYNINTQNKLQGTAHAITVRSAGFLSAGLLKPMVDNENIHIAIKPLFISGDVVIISDCQSAEIFIIKNASANGQVQHIVSTLPLAKKYNETASISAFEINTLQVEKTNRSHVNALYELNLHHRKTELVEGIDEMIFSYDIKQQKHILTLNANQITDWSQVVGINIDITISHSPITKHWKTYVAL
jgi:Tfp pilus assembly protein PilV